MELWDLVSALSRVIRRGSVDREVGIVYDDTPIHVHMARVKEQLGEKGRVRFRDLFRPGMHKSALVGIFLAILELVRHRQARAEQGHLFAELWVLPGPEADGQIDAAAVDQYEHGQG